MTLNEIEQHFGKIEYKELKRGWVEITNRFESKYLVTVNLPFVGKKRIHKKIKDALLGVLLEIEKKAKIFQEFEYITDLQIWAPRHIGRDKRKRLSSHTWGIAVDVNPLENLPGCLNPTIPGCVVEIFKKHGFVWGGDWRIKDYMHFEPSKNFFDYVNIWRT